MTDPAQDLLLEARQAAQSAPPLLVAARDLAASLTAGLHGRRQSGSGDQFWQFRRTQPGDAVTAVDWRQSAKSDHLYVRETEWAAAHSVWMWADRSPSMDWASAPALPLKSQRAALLALSLAVLLSDAGERIALLGGDHPPSSGAAALARLAREMTIPPIPTASFLPQSGLPRHGHAVVASDFLAPPAKIETALRTLTAAGGQGCLVHLQDPAEVAFPFTGRVRFQGLEGEGEMLAPRAETLAEAYRDQMRRHCDFLDDLARRLHWPLIRHRTDQPPAGTLLSLCEALGRRTN